MTAVRKRPPDKRQPLRVSPRVVAESSVRAIKVAATPFDASSPPPGVVPEGHAIMAQDDAMSSALTWAQSGASMAWSDGQVFLGYPELSLLAQRPEYRRISEIIANEMTRKWIKITSAGEVDKTQKIVAIEKAMKRLHVQDRFKQIAEQDGLFGRSHLYIDLGTTDDRDELMTNIGDGAHAVSREKIAHRSLRALRVIEPVWCYPSTYNSIDPLKGEWYNPSSWFVMGKQVHASRLLTFIARDVPDILKPAYSFGGLSLSQMAKPYIDNWLRTRQSVADIINAFSVFVLKTKAMDSFALGDDEIVKRAEVFNNMRNNRGLWIIDKEDEDFANISAPLGSLDKLEAQAQEHMASVSGIPIVKLLGIQPSGLNASSEGELECFYTWVNCQQEGLFRKPLTCLLNIIQLSEFGEVDPDIGFEFEPLQMLDEVALAGVKKTEAETGEVLIRAGVITRLEERKRIAADEQAAYASLDLAAPLPLPAAERADVGVKVSAAVIEAFNAGLIDAAKGLTELKNAAPVTGLFTSISNEDIVEAKLEPPPIPEVSEFGAPNDEDAIGLVPKPEEPLLKGAPKPMNAVKREVEAQ